MLNVVNDIPALRTAVREARMAGKKIGFVPTMGNLHEGHTSLVVEARNHTDYIVSSIFVNPMQFGKNEDLDNYPRTLEADIDKLNAVGTDLLFTPTNDLIYPQGLDQHTRVSVPHLTEGHCGASRPGHFDGVSTVVTILFNLVQPDVAVFGEKDYQQLAIIRKMTQDLHLPITIIGHPTVREADGLAKSSRNGYLSSTERAIAPQLNRIIQGVMEQIRTGSRDYDALAHAANQQLTEAGFRPDYFNIANSATLKPAQPEDTEITLLVAAFLGSTRLIDNQSMTL